MRVLTRLFHLPALVLLPLTSGRLPACILLDFSPGPLTSSTGSSCSPHSGDFCRRCGPGREMTHLCPMVLELEPIVVGTESPKEERERRRS